MTRFRRAVATVALVTAALTAAAVPAHAQVSTPRSTGQTWGCIILLSYPVCISNLL